MTSSNGNIFRVIGHLYAQRPVTQSFSLICVWINGWVNNREAGDLRRYRAHYDVTVMQKRHPTSRPHRWALGCLFLRISEINRVITAPQLLCIHFYSKHCTHLNVVRESLDKYILISYIWIALTNYLNDVIINPLREIISRTYLYKYFVLSRQQYHFRENITVSIMPSNNTKNLLPSCSSQQ